MIVIVMIALFLLLLPKKLTFSHDLFLYVLLKIGLQNSRCPRCESRPCFHSWSLIDKNSTITGTCFYGEQSNMSNFHHIIEMKTIPSKDHTHYLIFL